MAINGAVMSVVIARITSRVMLCGGRVSERELLLMAASGRWVIVLAAVSCQTCAFPLALKLLTFTVEGVVPVSSLDTIMTVNARSTLRAAANAETLSGLGTEALMLVSPKVLFAPS